MNTDSNKNTAVMGIIAVVVIGLIIAGTILLKPKESTPNGSTTTNSSQSDVASDTPAPDPNATYKDGTYTAEGDYSSPGGNEEVSVTITIMGGKVTDSSVTPKAASNESREYQADFVNGYKAQVTGKELAAIKLSRVSGSSLTSRGFNEALDAIRNQAQS